MSPNCGGTSFGGPVFDLQTAPILGSALGWVQERVCVMVAADHYQLCGPMPMIAVSVCSHLSPIPDGGCGGAWRLWWQRVVAGIEVSFAQSAFQMSSHVLLMSSI